jgi:hypothetical protein
MAHRIAMAIVRLLHGFTLLLYRTWCIHVIIVTHFHTESLDTIGNPTSPIGAPIATTPTKKKSSSLNMLKVLMVIDLAAATVELE